MISGKISEQISDKLSGKMSEQISEQTNKKLVEWILKYQIDLTNSYPHGAWYYFDYEDIKVHPLWNGYRCRKCKSACAVKNKEGICIKCLVIKEKIDVLNKILNQMKGGNSGKHDNN